MICEFVKDIDGLNRFFYFAAGTQVVVGLNSDGSFITRNIEDLKPGDLVLSRDEFEATGRVEFKPIVATSEKTSDHLRIVTLMDEAGNISTIRTTDEHPFYVMGIGWTSAKELEGGQQLATADSTRTLTVLSSIREERAQGVKVYNFTVADNHTYFVTDAPTRGPPGAVWVHNQCATKLRKNMIKQGVTFRKNDVAHHIVSRYDTRADAVAARGVLRRVRINLDEAVNGAKLNRKMHKGIHTEDYYKYVANTLKSAERNGRPAVEAALKKIATELKAGQKIW